MPNTHNLPDYDPKRVIEQRDGFYWLDIFGEKRYGPFPTRFDAVQNMQEQDSGNAEEVDDGLLDSSGSAEDEIGIADWIDPDTGEPAEESSTHIRDD
jgi:hypothetical protein